MISSLKYRLKFSILLGSVMIFEIRLPAKTCPLTLIIHKAMLHPKGISITIGSFFDLRIFDHDSRKYLPFKIRVFFSFLDHSYRPHIYPHALTFVVLLIFLPDFVFVPSLIFYLHGYFGNGEKTYLLKCSIPPKRWQV